MYNHISHSASQICRVSFYIVTLLARINARIQALLRQGFDIPSGNVRVLSADFHGHERGGLKTGRTKSVERGDKGYQAIRQIRIIE